MAFRDITIDDLKDKLDMKGSLFDILVATAERAKEIYDNEKKALSQTQPIHENEKKPTASVCAARPKRRRDQTPSVAKNSDESDHGGSSSRTESKRSKIPNCGAEQPPLPEEFKNAIEEMARARNITPTPGKLVIQKGLLATDLSSGHNRLSIPISQIADDFLTEGEKQHLRGHDKKKKKYLDVKIVEPSLTSETVKLCRWDMPKKGGGKTSSSYVINGKWNTIVAKNKLRLGMVVQLWCFRVDQDLCFALVRLPRNRAA